MNILLVGSGGRESAYAWNFEKHGHKVIFAPGNGGARNRRSNVQAMNFEALNRLAALEKADLTIFGAEAPLCAGGWDYFNKNGYCSVGPSKVAAEVTEGSKVKSGYLVVEAGAPSPRFYVSSQEGIADACKRGGYIEREGAGNIVVKAEGQCGGKGVFLPETLEEIPGKCDELRRLYKDQAARFVLQERLYGPECSMIFMCDGETSYFFPTTQDYKRRTKDSKSPNTGGMGAFTCPLDPGTERTCQEICLRIVAALRRRNIVYRGLMYVGFILTAEGPKVLEINCRGGDPEMQAILACLSDDFDFGAYCLAMATGKLHMLPAPKKAYEAVCVNLVSKAYPASSVIDAPIEGINEAWSRGALVFHGATRLDDGVVMTNKAGRVLSVVGVGANLLAARRTAYQGVIAIKFDEMDFPSYIAQ